MDIAPTHTHTLCHMYNDNVSVLFLLAPVRCLGKLHAREALVGGVADRSLGGVIARGGLLALSRDLVEGGVEPGVAQVLARTYCTGTLVQYMKR